MSSPRILSHTSETPTARLSVPFLETLKPNFSSHSWIRLSQAFPVCWRLPRPAGNRCARRHRYAAGQREGHFERSDGQGLRALVRRPARGRARGQKAEVRGVRRAREASLTTSNATSTRSTARAAYKRPQARSQPCIPCQVFWLEKDFQFASLIRKQPGQLPRPTSQRGNPDS